MYNKILLFLLTTIVVTAASAVYADAPESKPANAAAIPTKISAHHNARFKEKAAIVAAGGVDLVLLGDSITHRLDSTGKTVQDKHLGEYKRVNLGFGGIGTHHLLWVLDNIDADAIHPKAVMLLIGTNNIGWLKQTPEMTIGGVEAIVAKVRTLWPDAKLLVMGVFPRSELPTDPSREKVRTVNAAISKLADGKNVVFMDIGDKFLNQDGVETRDILSDFVHPTVKGYEIWLGSVAPTLKDWLK
ncbi:MAG: GDSL family lipase [Thermoguttaceae bacterium]|nr:GDSL family lipase [Thermoguttaceae bacterium]